jgi:hypothetical protein
MGNIRAPSCDLPYSDDPFPTKAITIPNTKNTAPTMISTSVVPRTASLISPESKKATPTVIAVFLKPSSCLKIDLVPSIYWVARVELELMPLSLYDTPHAFNTLLHTLFSVLRSQSALAIENLEFTVNH